MGKNIDIFLQILNNNFAQFKFYIFASNKIILFQLINLLNKNVNIIEYFISWEYLDVSDSIHSKFTSQQ